jgi:hypothetical protein
MNFPQQLPLTIEKRWYERRQRFIPPANCARPEDYAVAPIPERHAREFVALHHYAGHMPAARLCVGLLRRRDGHLVGVAVFSHPMSQSVLTKWLGHSNGCELGRFCLLDSEGFNAETIFLARALRILRVEKPTMNAVLSFSDPVERRHPVTDQILKRAHFGQVYRAKGAEHLGRSSVRSLLVAPDQTVISPRALSKIRAADQGREYAERQIVAAGVSPRAPHESGAAWLQRIAGEFTRVHHPGNLAFSFTL